MAKVVLENVCKDFGKVQAVSCFYLDIEDREFCVLLGPSGCGKSTTLHMIAGLEEMNEGKIYIGDRCVNEIGPRDRDIAMVFQDYALYPHMTVRQNMAFGLKLRKFPKKEIKTRVREAAGILGIEELLDRKPRELSGGQRQRVALGRAIVRKPAVFLFDEPLSNLDAKLRAQMRTEISKLHDNLKATMIYVTHDQVEAMTLGDRVAVMSDGQVQQIDRPETIYAHPANTFVATFIGSPEMNLYKGRLTSKDGRLCFQGPGFSLDLVGLQLSLEEGDVELGIRPEDIEIGQGGATIVQAKVDMLSNVGSEQYVHAHIGQEGLTVRVPKEATFEPGQNVTLSIDPGRVHIFHAGHRLPATIDP